MADVLDLTRRYLSGELSEAEIRAMVESGEISHDEARELETRVIAGQDDSPLSDPYAEGNIFEQFADSVGDVAQDIFDPGADDRRTAQGIDQSRVAAARNAYGFIPGLQEGNPYANTQLNYGVTGRVPQSTRDQVESVYEGTDSPQLQWGEDVAPYEVGGMLEPAQRKFQPGVPSAFVNAQSGYEDIGDSAYEGLPESRFQDMQSEFEDIGPSSYAGLRSELANRPQSEYSRMGPSAFTGVRSEFGNLGPSAFEGSESAYGQRAPSAYGDLRSEFGDMQIDAEGRNRLMGAGDYFGDVMVSGTDDIAEAEYERRAREAEQTRRAHTDAALRDLEMRGGGVGGGELLAELSGTQAMAGDRYQAGLDANAIAQRRRDAAAQSYGNIGESIWGEDARQAEAQAAGQDRIAAMRAGGLDEYSGQAAAGQDAYAMARNQAVDRYNQARASGMDEITAMRASGLDQYTTTRAGGVDEYALGRGEAMDRLAMEAAGGQDVFATNRAQGIDEVNVAAGTGLDAYNTERAAGRDQWEQQTAAGQDAFTVDRAGGIDEANQFELGRYDTVDAANADAINRASEMNFERQNQVSDANVDKENATTYFNEVGSPQTTFDNRLAVLGVESGALGAQAGGYRSDADDEFAYGPRAIQTMSNIAKAKGV